MSCSTDYISNDLWTSHIKQKALDYGFLACGISKAVPLYDDAHRLEKWLKQNQHAGMDYMERNFDLRIDVSRLVPAAQSVISLLYNYYPNEFQPEDTYHIAKYAYGKDYHKVIKQKLKQFTRELEAEIGDFQYRFFVDSAPVLERSWAQRSGLGWIGKNTNLLTKGVGSFFFICEIICDLPLEYDAPNIRHHCGTCTRCIEACPTQALSIENGLDANKCISYLTIEYKNSTFDKQLDFQDWIFGCDICQDVCPWNRHAKPNKEFKFDIRESIKTWSKVKWQNLSQDEFLDNMLNSPLKRTGYEGIIRNIKMNL